jgi:putative ABC transport system ATP-binding protein/lipoprotein-releasing system ATP-binding protein
MSALKVEHLEKELGEPKSHILKGLDFEIEEGEFVSLTGKSGSGKSTLLYVLSTLDAPSRGRVLFYGQDIAQMEEVELHRFRNKSIGFVFQAHYLLPELSALDNVLMPARKVRLHDSKREFAVQLLESVGLGDKLHHQPFELSGGQAQRVAIARALIMEPKFIFADEPTGALDSTNSALVFEIFKRINREMKTTIVMVTHDPDLAEATSRRIHLVDGKVVRSA